MIDFGAQYGEKVQRAIEATVEVSTTKQAQQTYREEESDDDSEASSELDDGIGPPMGPTGTGNQEDKACRTLVTALSQCPSMNLGLYFSFPNLHCTPPS